MALSRARVWATGANALAVTVLVALLAGVLAEIADDRAARLDLSEDGAMTLDPDTVAAITAAAERGQTIVVTAFSAQAKDEAAWARDRSLKDFLAALQSASGGAIETRFVDFDADRLTAERLGVDRYGTLVVQSKGDRVDITDRELFRIRGPKTKREVSFIGEPAVAAALRRVSSGRRGMALSLSGHGERELYDRGLGELKALATLIESQGLQPKTEGLASEGSGAPAVPPGVEVVLILGPKGPMSPGEISALRAFLRGGGGIAVLTESSGSPPAFLEDLGLSVEGGVVLDPVSQFPNPDRPILAYGAHPVTEAVAREGVSTVVSVASPVQSQPQGGITADVLLKTSRQGWIERGSEPQPSYDPSIDGAGPVPVAYALTLASPHPWGGDKPGRLVLIGDVDVATDELMSEGPGNKAFIAGALRWLAGRDEAPAMVGRPSAVRMLELGQSQLAAIRILLVGLVPGLVAAAGAMVLYARRQR